MIRLAVGEDALVLARLRYAFRAGIGEAVEDEASFVDRCARWMGRRLEEASAWRCWVAEADDEIQGNIWLQLIEKLPNPVVELERHGYITNAFVLEAARNRGLGGRLLSAALAYCREAGVDSVILWPTEHSRSLYARHGFAVRDDIMEAVLDSGRSFSPARPKDGQV